MHLKVLAQSQAFTIVKVVYDANSDLTVEARKGDTHAISGLLETLNYKGSDENGVNFDLVKT